MIITSIPGKALLIIILLVLLMPAYASTPASAVKPSHTPNSSKMVPTKGAQAGHPFTIIDTPLDRLIDGTVAVFKGPNEEIVVDLWTHKPYTTARGIVPEIDGGDYTVYFRQPDGSEIFLGSFGVSGNEPGEASISPASGPPGTPFIITDPQGRMKDANRIMITPEGMSPVEGLRLTFAWFSLDGTSASSSIPLNMPAGMYYLTVHEGNPVTNPPLFDGLAFQIV